MPICFATLSSVSFPNLSNSNNWLLIDTICLSELLSIALSLALYSTKAIICLFSFTSFSVQIMAALFILGNSDNTFSISSNSILYPLIFTCLSLRPINNRLPSGKYFAISPVLYKTPLLNGF